MRSPTRSQNITQSIVQDLGVAIVTGKYTEANFPTESTLCDEYRAARTVLREAVKMLSSKGLLISRQRKGTVVAPEDHWNLFDPDVMRWLLQRRLSLDLLIDVTQIRLGVEPVAAGLAARNATDEGREDISRAVLRMMAAEEGDDDPLTSDMSFHVAVLQASGNRFCRQLHEMIETALRFSIRLTNSLKGVQLASIADHKAVADAILARDSAGAETAMREMIQGTLDLLLMLRENKALEGALDDRTPTLD